MKNVQYSTQNAKTETETGKTEKKPLSPEEKLIGSYKGKASRDFGKTWTATKLVLLENGKGEGYRNGEKVDDGTRKMVGKERVVCSNN